MSTMKIAYMGAGEGDSRVLAAADLAKAGVEDFRKTTFMHGESVDVDSAVAEALLGDSELFGSFSEVKGEQPTLPVPAEPLPTTESKGKPAVK